MQTIPVTCKTWENSRRMATTVEESKARSGIEFHPTDSSHPILTTDRETSQPNRKALEYWADGLEPIYLEGALARAQGGCCSEPRRPVLASPSHDCISTDRQCRSRVMRRATRLLPSALLCRPARLSRFTGVFFALLCREFLSRGLSALPSELDSCLILFHHVIFLLTMRTAAHSVACNKAILCAFGGRPL